jgi:hypothetical protein
MWDDATDLFSSDAVLELADVGIYEGVASIRRFHERSGPQGLRYGQMNNRLISNLLTSVSATGREARTRGVVFNMLGDYTAGTASLGIDVIENRFAKGADGIWRIREMRIFPIMATDYYQGWAKSRLVTAPETGAASMCSRRWRIFAEVPSGATSITGCISQWPCAAWRGSAATPS